MQKAQDVCQISDPLRDHPGDLRRLPDRRLPNDGRGRHGRRQAHLHAGNTGDCLNKVNSAYGATNPLLTTQNMADISLACSYVFQGKGALNIDSCTTQFDCADDERHDHLRRSGRSAAHNR